MDPFGMSPEQYMAGASWITAIATVATLAVVIFTARYAARQVNEAKELRRAQFRPYVVVSIDIEQQMLFMLAVENVGTTPAHNVRVLFQEPPRSTMKEIEEVRFLKEPTPTMPPSAKFRAYWESSMTVFSENQPYPYPMSYAVDVTYEDHHGHEFGPERYILDFRVYEGQAAGLKGMSELVKTLEKIQRQQEQSARRGIMVKVKNEDRAERRRLRPFVLRRALRERDKEGWFAFFTYLAAHFRRDHGLYEQPGRKKKA